MVRRPASLLLAATLALAACGGGETGSTAPAGASDADGTVATAPAPPPASPGSTVFTSPDAIEPLRVVAPLVAGGSADLSAFSATPTAFWFWAPG